MNGKLPHMPQLPAPIPQQQDPRIAFAAWSGLSPMQLETMGLTPVRCLCGTCQGVRLELDIAMHFDRNGAPMVTRRSEFNRQVQVPLKTESKA